LTFGPLARIRGSEIDDSGPTRRKSLGRTWPKQATAVSFYEHPSRAEYSSEVMDTGNVPGAVRREIVLTWDQPQRT
jgi:hypothetical protein